MLPSYQNGTVVGKDTLYFAVEPSVLNTTKVPDAINKIKLIKYEHEEVQKKWPLKRSFFSIPLPTKSSKHTLRDCTENVT